jgi:ABC-2 type transport system permease protein
VTGKFLGSLIVATFALIPTLVYYFTINHLASTEGIDSGAAAGSYLGLFLLTALFTSIGICISSFTTNSVVAFIISLIACVLFYFGFTAISQLPVFQNGSDYFIEMIGIDFHYQSISRGVIDTRDIIYFISIIVFLLLITRQNSGKKISNKRNSILWAGLVICLIAINFLASEVHTRFDLTEEKRYSLTNTSKILVRTLPGELNIEVFLEGDFPSEFRKLSNATKEFLTMLRESDPSKISYRFIDPQQEVLPGRTWGDSLQTLGASPINLSVQVKAGEENKIVFPYALIRYEDRVELVNLFQSSKRNITVAELNNAEAMMEYQFAKAMDRISNPQKPSIAYAIGNGQPEDASSFSFWYAIDPESVPDQTVNPEYFDVNEKSNYKLGLFNLEAQRSIPDEIKVLVIVKPTISFSEAAKLKIDQYIMRGGKVLWFLDNLNAEPDSLSIKSQLIAYDRNLNLQDLLFTYGTRINPDLVMDLQCDFLPFAVGGSATDPQYEFLHWNYYPLFESRNNHTINKNIGLVAGRFVNSIDTIETSDIKKTYLLQSSANSRTISTPAMISPNENRNAPQDALFNQKDIPVAVLLEGKFTSFFRGRISRAQVDSLKELGGFRDLNAEENKMIVVADGDMVLNDVSSQGPLPMGMNLFTVGSQYQYQFANRDFLLNCLEYLTSKTNIIETRNKEIILRLLDAKKVEDERSKWQAVNIALPILLVIIFGFIYQQYRRYRFASN